MLGHPKEPLRDNRIIPTHHTLCAKLYGCNHHMGSSASSHTRLAACAARGTSGATVAPPSKKYYTRHYLNWHARAHVHRDTIRKHPADRHSVHRLLAECTPRGGSPRGGYGERVLRKGSLDWGIISLLYLTPTTHYVSEA